MRYVLMTGVTGLLGRYLIKDLLLAGVPVAVIARSARRATARSRVDAAVLYWENQLGVKLPRPVVLEGDITEPDLGLDGRALQWVAEHCDTMLHNAASLPFQSTGPDAEPWRSNVDGTQNVLEVCRQAGIRKFHHVSTAYVCGLRSGICKETELDEGQQFSNDYEQSKVEAEKLVRGSDFIDSLTVFRPAIIIGDSKTGYTTTYHGFYAPVQGVWTLAQHTEHRENGWIETTARFALNGTETKNLVPVEWVSAVMAHVMTHPELHGETYHLTPQHATTLRMFGDVLEEAAKIYAVDWMGTGADIPNMTEHEVIFHQMITVYRSYWKNDPQFDATNTLRAAPHLPCPHVTKKMLTMMANWAIENEFDQPKGRQPEPEFDALSLLEPLLEQFPRANAPESAVSLQVRGHGGGQWHLILQGGQLVAADHGLAEDPVGTLELDVETLAELSQGRLKASQAIADGRVRVEGTTDGLAPANLLRDLTRSQVKALQPQ